MSRIMFVFSGTALLLGAGLTILATRQRSGPSVAASVPRASPASALAGEIGAVDDAASDGARWYVADSRNHQVHVLDTAGRYVRSFGQQGRGPGEFISPNLVAAAGAMVYVAEPGRASVSVFDSTGTFIRHLRAQGACNGMAVAMDATVDALYVLRRCMEPPKRVRFQVERSLDAKTLATWDAVADTILLDGKGGVPLQFPLFSVDDEWLVLGEGGDSCLRLVRLPDGVPEGTRCLRELPRHEWPAEDRERDRARWRGRVQPPDSLPRALQVALTEHGIAAQSFTGDGDLTNWYVLPRQSAPDGMLTPVGRRDVRQSYFAAGRLLLVSEHEEGIRFEVIHVGR